MQTQFKQNNKKLFNTWGFKNASVLDNEAFKIIKAMNLIAGFNNPHLEFKQVTKGIFVCDYLKNIHLEVENSVFAPDIIERSGCVLRIYDTYENKRSVSRFIKSTSEFAKIVKKIPSNKTYKTVKNLYLDDFQIKEEPTEYFHRTDICLEMHYISANFKINENETDELFFGIQDDSILFVEPMFASGNYKDADVESQAVFLENFKNNYEEIYDKEIDFDNNPYLNFFK